MQKIYKVAIIGGGASGLISAVELCLGKNCFLGSDIAILERSDRVGKKLISTGNGQGNLSNAEIGENNYYGDKDFIKAFFNSNKITISEYFSELGIPFVTEKNGKQYPMSKQASAVLDIIRNVLDKKGVNIFTNSLVLDIKNDYSHYNITCGDGNVYKAENIILAFGGKSAKQFGTDGSSYVLAEKFGHKLTKLYPSLVQLKTSLEEIKGLKGVKEKARISAFDGNKFLKSVCGDVLFTEYGISGDAVFNISSTLVDKANPYVILEFLPNVDSDEIVSILERRKRTGLYPTDKILDGIVNKKVGSAILKLAKSYDAVKITDTLKNYKLKITGNLGFNYSQVTKGGISTEYVNPKTFESQIKKGVYLIGELLNVDGDCGGYNLDFAFKSGIIASKNIKNNTKEKWS